MADFCSPYTILLPHGPVTLAHRTTGALAYPGHAPIWTAGAPSGLHGSLVVSDNDELTGVRVFLGALVLSEGLDFKVGADAATTASNIAQAISEHSGWRATSIDAEVAVEYSSPLGRVLFQARDNPNGGLTLDPATGFLGAGNPR